MSAVAPHPVAIVLVVAVADNGVIGVEKAHELHPDLVVMDVEMPGLGGVEVCRIVLMPSPDCSAPGCRRPPPATTCDGSAERSAGCVPHPLRPPPRRRRTGRLRQVAYRSSCPASEDGGFFVLAMTFLARVVPRAPFPPVVAPSFGLGSIHAQVVELVDTQVSEACA